jgi:hypothetical protein
MAQFEGFETKGLNTTAAPAIVTDWNTAANNAVKDGRQSLSNTSHLPGIELFDSRTLIADGSTSERPPVFLQGGIYKEAQREAEKIADGRGEVPFGSSLDAGVSTNKEAPKGYLVTALPIEGLVGTGRGHREIIDVNIGDSLKVNNESVIDGKPHRGVFPISHKEGQESNWNWIDATIVRTGNSAMLQIHGVSPSADKPNQAGEWDKVNWSCPLRYQSKPQHLNAQAYWDATEHGNKTTDASILQSRISSVVVVRESARDL